MYKFVLRRLIQAIPTLFGITLLSFALMSLSPGGPLGALAFGPGTPPAQRERLAASLGLNDPWVIQYLRWLTGDDWMRRDTDGDGVADWAVPLPGFPKLDADGDGVPEPVGTSQGIIRLDFGRSFAGGGRTGPPAMLVLFEKMRATFELGFVALTIGLIIGVPIGILAAVNRGRWFDSSSRVMAVVFDAVPIFWLGLLLILAVGVGRWPQAFGWDFRTNWLEFSGRSSVMDLATQGDTPAWVESMDSAAEGWTWLPEGFRNGVDRRLTLMQPYVEALVVDNAEPIWTRWEYMVLPVIVLVVGLVAGYSRFARASMLDVINQDYMRTARAKGLANPRVWFVHGARNALIPIATFLGPAFTGLLSGALITETIFSYQGVGLTVFGAVQARNYPVVMAAVMLAGVATILGYLLSDVLYAIIDPRIRYD